MNFLFFELQINSNTCKTCVPKMEKIKFEIECSYVGVTVQPGCPLYFCFYDRVIFFCWVTLSKNVYTFKASWKTLGEV